MKIKPIWIILLLIGVLVTASGTQHRLVVTQGEGGIPSSPPYVPAPSSEPDEPSVTENKTAPTSTEGIVTLFGFQVSTLEIIGAVMIAAAVLMLLFVKRK